MRSKSAPQIILSLLIFVADNTQCQNPRIEMNMMPLEEEDVMAAVALAEAFKEQISARNIVAEEADPARAMGEQDG